MAIYARVLTSSEQSRASCNRAIGRIIDQIGIGFHWSELSSSNSLQTASSYEGSDEALGRPLGRIFQAPHSGPQRDNRPYGAFKKHRLIYTLFVGLPRFELGTFGPPDRAELTTG